MAYLATPQRRKQCEQSAPLGLVDAVGHSHSLNGPVGEKAEADDETILDQSGSAEDNTTETGSSGPLRLRLSAHGLALPVIQDVAAQLSLFGGVDLTPEKRFELTMEMTKCAVGQEDCSGSACASISAAVFTASPQTS